MKKQITKRFIQSVAVVLIGIAVVSCRSTREVVNTARIKPVSAAKLMKNVETNAFKYDKMEISRIACQFENSKTKLSLRASLKAKNGDTILVSLNKLNIPVGKLLLTTDSVKFVNYIDKNYFISDYESLSQKLNADIDFNVINSILSNNAFSLQDEEKRDNEFKDFTSEVDSGMYVLQSIKERKFNKFNRKGKEKKADRYLKRRDEEQLIRQTLYIDPDYRLRKVALDDQLNKRSVKINFDEFMEVEKQFYPGTINLQFNGPKENLKLEIKLSKLSFEKDLDFNFRIPEKYSPAK